MDFCVCSFAASAGVALTAPMLEAATQHLSSPTLRSVRGIGLDDPELVQLSINENPLGSSRRAIEAVAKQMFGMNRYPFHDELEQALASHHGVKPENILHGVGSTEVLNMLSLAAFHDKSGNTVTAYPSYPYVPRRTEELGREVKRVPLKDDFGTDLDAMARAIDAETRIVFICNPNNPTGQLLDAAELQAFVRNVRDDIIVCLDEGLHPFRGRPRLPHR